MVINKKTDIKKYLTPEELEKQEHLSVEKLKLLMEDCNEDCNTILPNIDNRPPSNFIDLMNWTNATFSSFTKENDVLNKFVHNRIIIDGQFLLFCELKNISIKCLYKDSVISWKTDGNYEKFFAQGVFLIKGKDFEFIQAALFHKGNQNEDEISFFVLVSNKNYDDYIKIRNEFDEWVSERDRGNLHIRVIDGEDIPYTKDNSWEKLFLPEDIKKDMKDLVENFLNSKDFYLENKIPWKRGVLLYGKPGCHIKGTKIIMSDGTTKNVEDIKVGDYLCGPDSKPREVLKLVNGNELCYEIFPNKGDSFIVNENHILHLCYSSNTQKNLPKYLDLTVKELLQLSKPLQTRLKLRKSNLINFNILNELPLDPYMLGLWLGDGTTGAPEITSADQEIINYCKKYAKNEGLSIRITPTISKAYTIRFSKGSLSKNTFTSKLRELGIFDKKSIPQIYLSSSDKDRYSLLAGLIDTDGSHNIFSKNSFTKYLKTDNKKGCFDFIQKDKNISDQIGFLARSLGLGFTIKICNKGIKKTGFMGTYYRSSIYGDIYKIPTILPRKQPGKGNPNKNNLNIGIKEIKKLNNRDYYGFVIDEDHLYLSDDFFIHHNCGKTSIIKTIISEYNFKPVTIVPGANVDSIRDAFSYAEKQSPSLLYFEDLDSLIEAGLDVSSFLNFMDGISSKNGLLVIATANDVKKLKTNITKRPSRFDRKFEISLPNEEMAYIYLKRWFGAFITTAKCRSLAKLSVKHEFSYAYLKELYISSMFEALSHNKKAPSVKDIDDTLKRLVKENSMINNGNAISTDKYFDK